MSFPLSSEGLKDAYTVNAFKYVYTEQHLTRVPIDSPPVSSADWIEVYGLLYAQLLKEYGLYGVEFADINFAAILTVESGYELIVGWNDNVSKNPASSIRRVK